MKSSKTFAKRKLRTTVSNYHFISKLTSSVSIGVNNPKELQAFAVDLKMCLKTLTGIGCVNEINNQKVLRQIIDRLPVPLQHKWRALADSIMHKMKRAVSIEDVVYFVSKQAREINNPIFGVPLKNKSFLNNNPIEVDK